MNVRISPAFACRYLARSLAIGAAALVLCAHWALAQDRVVEVIGHSAWFDPAAAADESARQHNSRQAWSEPPEPDESMFPLLPSVASEPLLDPPTNHSALWDGGPVDDSILPTERTSMLSDGTGASSEPTFWPTLLSQRLRRFWPTRQGAVSAAPSTTPWESHASFMEPNADRHRQLSLARPSRGGDPPPGTMFILRFDEGLLQNTRAGMVLSRPPGDYSQDWIGVAISATVR